MNSASAIEVADHLVRCDTAFTPALSTRVDIQTFARKIVLRATRFEAWSAGHLVGLVAAYCNDAAGHTAFVTNVSVAPGWQGRGIASRLLERCISHARDAAFEQVDLQVHRHNTRAISLYGNAGFVVTQSDDCYVVMRLILRQLT